MNHMKSGSYFYQLAISVLIFAELFALGIFAYTGSFVRYMADDYCEINILGNGAAVEAVYDNYMDGEYRAANRFSNLLFIAGSELLEIRPPRLVPASMLALWLVGLAWLIRESWLLAKGKPDWLMVIVMTSTLVFFSVWQAPNRFQTFYWRSSVATHFAPLVFFALLTSFVLFQIRSSNGRRPSFWLQMLLILMAFFAGGFSEPPTAVMLVGVILALICVWKWGYGPLRNPALMLGGSAYVGVFLALIALFVAPGNQLHGTMSLTALPATLVMSFRFTFDFMRDTVLSFPLPTLLSGLIPALVFYSIFSKQHIEALPSKWIQWLLGVVPLLGYLLIAASFAPSAYGQYFPAERARFLGRVLMTAVLLVEGGLLGSYLSRWKIWPARSFIVALLLIILAVYPLRAGFGLLAEASGLRAWSIIWDERDAGIRAAVAAGATDLSVIQLDSIGDVIEYKGDPQHWVNLCAAQYYGLNSLVAP
jgi:hypothetical protein